MKNYITWLKTAAIVQFLAAILHATSMLLKPPAANETEKQLFALMDTYKFDFGAGFYPTMSELTLVESACFSLVCLLGGLTNWYLLRKKVGPQIIEGIININLLVFGICFGLTAAFTYLPPIILTGLIILSLILSKFTLRKNI